MPAPDYETLYDPESAVEGGIVAILQARGLTAVRQCGTSELSTPRVEVQYVNGAHTSQRGADNAGNHIFNEWEGTLVLTIKTNREKTSPSTTHRSYMAKCRLAMLYFMQLFTAERFPYHQIAIIREAGTQPDISADEMLDISVIQFSCRVHIRPDAWPVV